VPFATNTNQRKTLFSSLAFLMYRRARALFPYLLIVCDEFGSNLVSYM
jgi:hypothetical protein